MGNDVLSVWVLYLNPTDHPDKAVIREQRILPGGSIENAVEAHFFDDERAAYTWGHLANLGVWFDRQPGDKKSIVGAWV